jgi:hypothetical protein
MEGMEAEPGDVSGMGMDDELEDDTSNDFLDKLHDCFDGFDDKVIYALGDEDMADIHTVKYIHNMGRRKRRVKFRHPRIHWEKHLRELNETDVCANGKTDLDECFRMRLHHFDHLHMLSGNISPLISKDPCHLLRVMIPLFQSL